MPALIAILLFIAYFGVSSLLRGASLAVWWDWFISGPEAPFHNSVPDISTIQALGVSLVVTALVYQYTGTDEDEDTAVTLLRPLGVLAILWVFALIYRSFM